MLFLDKVKKSISVPWILQIEVNENWIKLDTLQLFFKKKTAWKDYLGFNLQT